MSNRILRFVPYKKQLISRYKHLLGTKNNTAAEAAVFMKSQHFSAHNLRHTFCTRLCENETNLKVIQEIMGHRNIETTMDVYNEATKEKKMSSFANLEGKIRVS